MKGPQSPLRLTGFFMSRSSLSFCSSAAFLGMTSVCGSFLGLGGLTEAATGLAIAAFLLPRKCHRRLRVLMTTELRASRARALLELGALSGARALSLQGPRGGVASLTRLLEYSWVRGQCGLILVIAA